MSLVEQAVALVPDQPIAYSEWINLLMQNGIADTSNIVPQVRKSRLVKFEVEPQADGAVVHTVSKQGGE